MDIALVSTYPPQHCGIGTYTRDLALALRAKDHKVTVLAERVPKEPTVEDNIFRVWTRSAALRPLLTSISSSPKKPDVVHFQHEFGLFPMSEDFWDVVDGLLGFTRVAITLHTVAQPPERVSFFRKLATYSRHPNLSIIVHTTPAGAALEDWWPCNSRTFVIPHGVTIQREEIEEMERFTVLVPGFISKSKGHEDIIAAFARLYRTDPRCRLILAGECRNDDYRYKIGGWLSQYGVYEATKFEEGYHATLDTFFKRATVVVLGSGENTPFSASGQLHSALGWGHAVLAKRSQIYMHSPGGVLYYADEKELAAYLQHLYSNRPVLKELRATSHRARHQRSWPAVVDMHIAAYSS